MVGPQQISEELVASEIAERVAIINDGRIVQVGTIDDVLARPASLFVARFTRTRDFFDATAEPAACGARLRLGNGVVLHTDVKPPAGPVTVGIRPEDVEIAADAEARGGQHCIRGTVVWSHRRRAHLEIGIDLRGLTLVACSRLNGELSQRLTGQPVLVHVPPGATKVFPRETRR